MLTIETSAPTTGASIIIRSHGPAPIRVHPLAPTMQDFEVATQLLKNGEGISEFIVMLPGDYEIYKDFDAAVLHVTKHRELSFTAEFGLLSSLVAIFLSGVIIWTKSKRNKISSEGGSF